MSTDVVTCSSRSLFHDSIDLSGIEGRTLVLNDKPHLPSPEDCIAERRRMGIEPTHRG